VAALQTSGQIAGWLHWRGFPIASPAALGRNAQAFRAAVRRYADGNQIPWVVFRKGDRKLDVVRPYLDAAEKAGRSEVVAIGEAREFQWVFDDPRRVRTVFEELLAGNIKAGPPGARGGHLRAEGDPPHAWHLLHPAAEPRRPGHGAEDPGHALRVPT
jgi:hypothetical protein